MYFPAPTSCIDASTVSFPDMHNNGEVAQTMMNSLCFSTQLMFRGVETTYRLFPTAVAPYPEFSDHTLRRCKEWGRGSKPTQQEPGCVFQSHCSMTKVILHHSNPHLNAITRCWGSNCNNATLNTVWDNVWRFEFLEPLGAVNDDPRRISDLGDCYN